MERVLGVDGCPGGWVAVLLDGGASSAWTATTLAALVALGEPVECVAVDIPLGLPDAGRREADALARKALGRRGVTVFDAAVREAYESGTHADGNARHRELTGRGLSVQAWHLGPRVLDACAFASSGRAVVIEAHPELSFAAMAGTALLEHKRTAEGARVRRQLLVRQGIDIPAPPRPARPDDLLDACAVAWTARRYVADNASSYPEDPEVFSDGLAAAIWA